MTLILPDCKSELWLSQSPWEVWAGVKGKVKGRPSDSLTARASDHLSPTSPLPRSLAYELVIYAGFVFSVVKYT